MSSIPISARWRLSTLAASAMLASCGGGGGGINSDDNGATTRLTCPVVCVSSSATATDQIRPSYVIVGDGSRVQAQAGFSTGTDPRFNVELTGTDSLQLSTATGLLAFHIPATSLAAVFVDAFKTLITGATPYLSEITPSTVAMPVQFQFMRGTTVYSSAVTLPAPFTITTPAASATLPIATRSLAVRLTSTTAGTTHNAGMNCTDTNGNTANASRTAGIVAGSQVTDVGGTSYAIDIGPAIDSLVFTTTFPRGAVARCDVTLQIITQANGTPDTRFATTQVFAQQIRSVAFSLR